MCSVFMLYKECMENVEALQLVLDAEFVGRVGDYRYENRLPSRNEAIPCLLNQAPSADQPPKKKAPTKKAGKK